MLFIFQKPVQEPHNFCGSGSGSCFLFFGAAPAPGFLSCGSGFKV